MTSPTDILTTLKNVVQGINNASQTYLNVQGALGAPNLAATALLKSGAGRVCTVIVTTAGSASGTICDSNSIAITTNVVYNIPMTIGVYVLNFPLSLGLVVAPGTGQVVSVSYS